MGKKRGLRDFLIVIIAILGTMFIFFNNNINQSLQLSPNNQLFFILGVVFLIIALGISLSRLLIK